MGSNSGDNCAATLYPYLGYPLLLQDREPKKAANPRTAVLNYN